MSASHITRTATDIELMYASIAFAIAVSALLSACSEEKMVKEPKQQEMSAHGMTSDWKFALPQGDPAEGRKLFAEVECYKCHEVKGEKFPSVAEGEKGIGPELSQMAGMHPREFFAESIVNPNAVIDSDAKKLGYVGDDGKSKMPDFSSSLTVKQVADLASYIESLKGQTPHDQMSH